MPAGKKQIWKKIFPILKVTEKGVGSGSAPKSHGSPTLLICLYFTTYRTCSFYITLFTSLEACHLCPIRPQDRYHTVLIASPWLIRCLVCQSNDAKKVTIRCWCRARWSKMESICQFDKSVTKSTTVSSRMPLDKVVWWQIGHAMPPVDNQMSSQLLHDARPVTRCRMRCRGPRLADWWAPGWPGCCSGRRRHL